MSLDLTVHVEQADDGFWTYVQHSAGELPKTPLHTILKWVIEQLNFGNFEGQQDSCGDVVSMTIGSEAAAEFVSADEAVESAKHRRLSVISAGALAESRESGIAPEHAATIKAGTRQPKYWTLRNTEFHYAFELIQVLARLNDKTFKLESPPITGLAPEGVVSYLRESTRCFLYGFHGASVALSRACLEDALKARPPAGDRTGYSPQLKDLIDAARRSGLLDDTMAEIAHSVRKTANRFLHGQLITESDSRETLDATRGIVEQIFSS